MAWRRQATRHHPNQSWPIIKGVLWQSFGNNFKAVLMNLICNVCWEITLFKLLPHHPVANEFNHIHMFVYPIRCVFTASSKIILIFNRLVHFISIHKYNTNGKLFVFFSAINKTTIMRSGIIREANILSSHIFAACCITKCIMISF